MATNRNLVPHDLPPSLKAVLTTCPPSAPLEEGLHRFWSAGPELDTVTVDLRRPDEALELLELLGTSPFPRGGFPFMGFLATTYEKVGRYALERG